jgi:hypothetical protein
MSIPGKNKFEYSLDLLQKINAVKVGSEPVLETRIMGDYSYWMFFQHRIFYNDIKEYLSGASGLPRKRAWSIQIKEWGLALLALVVSLGSLLLAKWKGARVVVYSVDRTNSGLYRNDARLNPVYEALLKEAEPFVEFFHTILGRAFISRISERGRLAFYQQGIDLLFFVGRGLGFFKGESVDDSFFDLSQFSAEERVFVKNIIRKYILQKPLIEFRINCYKWIFKLLKTKLILSIDDPRDYNEVVLGAKLAGVKFYAFQHGHFTKYHVGWLSNSLSGEFVRPDRLYVWSEFWKSELLRLGTYFKEGEIWVGGLKDPLPASLARKASELTVVIPFETESDKESVRKYIDEILADGRIKILFKLRSDMSAEDQISSSLLRYVKSPNLSFTSENQKVLKEGSVIAGTYSTYLYDMISFDKPIVYLDTQLDFGEGLLVHELAEKATLSTVVQTLRKASKIPEEVLKERKLRLCGGTHQLMVEAVRAAMVEFLHHE